MQILQTTAQVGGPHGPSDLPAGAAVESREELWALRPAPATTFYGLRCWDLYPSSSDFLNAFGMAKPTTDPSWYPEEAYDESEFATQHAAPGTWAPVTRDLIERGYELMITPDLALSAALEGEFWVRGQAYTKPFNTLTKVASRWLSGALRHAKPVMDRSAWRGCYRHTAPSDTGGWYNFGAVVEWFLSEMSHDRRLQHLRITPQLASWAMVRSACMHRDHNIDFMLARDDNDLANIKLRFQVANSVPNGTPFEAPPGASLH